MPLMTIFIFVIRIHLFIASYGKAKSKELKAVETSDLDSTDIDAPRRSKPTKEQFGKNMCNCA